jgi:tRNA-intron endonuclease
VVKGHRSKVDEYERGNAMARDENLMGDDYNVKSNAKDKEIEDQSIQGEVVDGRVIVSSKSSIDELARRGYGYKEEIDGVERYYLYMYEALYLLYTSKIIVKDKGRILTFDELVDEALKYDNSAWTKFLIYRDLRSRGYVVREGFGFNNDFRVYDRGDYSSKPARYVVFALNEGREVKIDTLSSIVEQISTMGKEPIMAVIERRGEVIYYKVSKMHFPDRG